MKKELVLGSGNKNEPSLSLDGTFKYLNPFKVDIDVASMPDLLWDLNQHPLPFKDEEFDEIHAYEVLEHLGRQGDWRAFFEEWNEYYRILKPGGLFFASVPMWNSLWAWGDPGHTRVIGNGTLSFLNQAQYEQDVGKTNMTDYRHVYKGNFEPLVLQETEDTFYFILRKI